MQAKQLIISIHDRDATSVSWIIFDNEANVIADPKTGPITEIPQPDAATKVIVLIPTIDLLILPVTLPNMPASHRSQAALFTLEEDLAEDIQNLHAAIIENNAQNQFYAIIVEKKLITSWLDKLHAVHIAPIMLVPDVYALPTNENEWTIAINHETVWTKISSEFGIAAESHLIQPILADLILNEKIIVKPMTIYNYTKQDVSNDFTILGQKIDVVNDSDQSFYINLLSNSKPDELNVNLLQGEFAPQIQNKSQQKRWRLTALMALLLFATIIFTVTIEWIYLTYQDNQLQRQIASLYHTAFPNAENIISPKFRIQQELNKLTALQHQSGFLYLLAIAGQAINRSDGVSIQSLNYTNNSLTMTVQAISAQSLDQVESLLKKQAITLKRSNTQSTGATITADFILSRSNA